MNPREFLDVASDLATGVREGDWRSAVSRAYYSAFHVARLLLVRCGFIVPRADHAHASVWIRLSNCGQLDVEQAGHDLDALRSSRNVADYDLNFAYPEKIAHTDVDVAADIIRLLDQVPAVPTVMQQITTAIRTYEQTVLRQSTWQGPANGPPSGEPHP